MNIMNIKMYNILIQMQENMNTQMMEMKKDIEDIKSDIRQS